VVKESPAARKRYNKILPKPGQGLGASGSFVPVPMAQSFVEAVKSGNIENLI